MEELDEPVKVGAVFSSSRVIPKWFVWANAKHEIKSVNLVWKARAGETIFRYISVSDSCNTYQLRLDQKTLAWRLEKVFCE